MTTKKEQIERFQEIPEIKIWLNGCELKPATRGYYAKRLYEFLGEESPEQFIDSALKEPRQVSIGAKTKIAKVAEKSESSAAHTRAAVKSFLEFYETQVHLNGKIKVRRKWNKPYLSWQNAEKIISKCREPYESIFRFMLWTGLGQDEVIEINENPTIQRKIAEQMANEKDYVVIDLKPRKSNLSRYFVIVPKKQVPNFPLKTNNYTVRGDKPIHVSAIEGNFRRAAKRVELYEKGVGPHTFRSAFTSACDMAGVAQAITEFAKGHGASDKYGYGREVLNEEYAVQELNKLWASRRSLSTAHFYDKRSLEGSLQ